MTFKVTDEYIDARIAERNAARAAGDTEQVQRIADRVRGDGLDFFALILADHDIPIITL